MIEISKPPTAATLFDVRPLLPVLEQGRVLLTPNRRLASRIRAALVEAALAQGAAVVPTPAVVALADWLDALWQEGGFRGVEGFDVWVLSAAQEQVLWEQVVAASQVGQSLLRPAQAAELAADALRTLVLWRQWPLQAGQRGCFFDTDMLSDADTACYLDWLDAFRRACTAQGCITAAERDARVVAALLQSTLAAAAPVALVCFDEIAPLHAQLFEHLQAEPVTIPARNQRAVAVACDSFEQQIRAAARWASAALLTRAGPFAIVVPNLGAQRQRVERILLDEFNADHLLPAVARQLPPVNFSAGEPLASTPIIQDALRLLALAQTDNARADLIALLQSPFHAIDAGQADLVAAAIAAICDLQSERIGDNALRSITAPLAEKYNGWIFDRGLQQLADHWRRSRLANARLPLSQWSEHFRFTLMCFGWPGTRTLDSIEYQQVSQWWELLSGLPAFDGICGALNFSGALVQLRKLAQAHVFQPKTPDAPIQVLGLLEAAGLQFEGTWLCDMSDDLWPPAAAPHPLLPRDWQRRLRMPHCDADREFDVAERLSMSLRANAHEFVVTYQRERDEVERHLSPLFANCENFVDCENVDLATLSIDPEDLFKPAQAADLQKTALQSFMAGVAPPLDMSRRARGGSALLADQAACPFRAFAKFRLGAEPLAEPQTGLTASERGTLLHAALQSLWLKLQSSAVLRACDDTLLVAHADDAARHALSQLPELQRWGARYLDLERQRLRRVLVSWLELEKTRADVEIVALEQERQFAFAGLELRLRVDRIDRLADGRVAIVDYKSGQNNSANAWLGERPEQPQLPLYALALENEAPGSVAGVRFAQVRFDTARWVGVGDSELESYALNPVTHEQAADWGAQLQFWREALQILAQEFIDGRADVAPATPKTCQYCALPDVCRIDHVALADDDMLFDGETEDVA